MLTGNVGEWSEIYVVLRLLADGRITLADSNLSPRPGNYLEIVEVHRNSADGQLKFVIDDDRESIMLEGNNEAICRRSEIHELSVHLFEALVIGGRSIQVPQLDNLLARMRTHQLTAPSTGKTDLQVLVRDGRTGEIFLMAFSVKSQIGGAATLLNASGATNFRYEVKGPRLAIAKLESLGQSPREIISQARTLQVRIDNGKPLNQTFESNLRMVDSGMPQIVATMLYGHFDGEGSQISDVSEFLELKDPIGVGEENAKIFYTHKVKDLLADIALGLTPSKKWDGSYVVNAGYMVVNRFGQVVCLMFEERDVFRQYLFSNTRFERGSRSRHNYGSIVRDSRGSSYLDLNLQIRFVK